MSDISVHEVKLWDVLINSSRLWCCVVGFIVWYVLEERSAFRVKQSKYMGLFDPEDGSIKTRRNFCNNSINDISSHARRPDYLSSLPYIIHYVMVRSQWPRCIWRRSAAARLLGLGSNPTGDKEVRLFWVLCVARCKSLRRADHSSSGVQLTVVRRCVWSRNFKNNYVMARVRHQRHIKLFYNVLSGKVCHVITDKKGALMRC